MGKNKNPAEAVEKRVKKYKHRLKKCGCCGAISVILGLIFLVIGIALLVHYAKYWGDEEHWQKGLAYTGAVLLFLGVAVIGIAIIVFIILCRVWKRFEGKGTSEPMFKPQPFPEGQAPYPQQPPPSSGNMPHLEPSAPQKSPGGGEAVQPEEHHKF